ncbi:MAG: hypothetical protein WHS89_14520 [Acidimicrobiales bacterium]
MASVPALGHFGGSDRFTISDELAAKPSWWRCRPGGRIDRNAFALMRRGSMW